MSHATVPLMFLLASFLLLYVACFTRTWLNFTSELFSFSFILPLPYLLSATARPYLVLFALSTSTLGFFLPSLLYSTLPIYFASLYLVTEP